jgi:hypothetical protein
MNLTEVTDLTSIGTLFAFVLVCGGVLLLPEEPITDSNRKRFRIPYVNSRYIVPLLIISLFIIFREQILALFKYDGDWHVYKDKLPYFLFIIAAITMSVLSFVKKLSLIPVLGLLSCLYLMTELGYTNWLRFLIWLALGLIIYFSYGYHKSRLNG